jgi:hypothetical protein
VTVLRCRLAGGDQVLRLACNRDEQRSRPVAVPPGFHRAGRGQAIWPTDPAGGGTWVAVNDAGLALALLNVNRGRIDAAPRLSRGSIIPSLAGCGTLDSALRCAANLCPADYSPFRLLLLGGGKRAEVVSDGLRLRVVPGAPIAGPLLFTSSGLGDDLVQGPRSELFRETLASSPGAEQQDAFHRSSWAERPHLSVCMRRGDARTVSYTTVTLSTHRAQVTYHPDAPDESSEPISLSLNIAKGVRS